MVTIQEGIALPWSCNLKVMWCKAMVKEDITACVVVLVLPWVVLVETILHGTFVLTRVPKMSTSVDKGRNWTCWSRNALVAGEGVIYGREKSLKIQGRI